MNFSITRPDPNGFGSTQFLVRREGNRIDVAPPPCGVRMIQDSYTMHIGEDRVDLCTPDREFRILMNSQGVTVDNPRMDGMRSFGYDLELQTPLKPEQYEGTGLSVAFSLIGLPVPPHFLQG